MKSVMLGMVVPTQAAHADVVPLEQVAALGLGTLIALGILVFVVARVAIAVLRAIRKRRGAVPGA